MKRIFFSFLFIIIVQTGHTQNLVLNPGLEDYITCPGFGQFDSIYVEHWTKPSWGSTDYYQDSCTGIEPVSQTPHGGNAYLGVIAYNYGTEYREYATGKLSEPLIAGTAYSVEFYVSLNDGYIQAVNEMDAYLSAVPPGPYSNSLHIAVSPQVENSSLLDDTATWMLVQGTVVAAGGEQYITIGNFNDDASTTIVQVGNVGSFGAYYFVDDIRVVSAKPTNSSSPVSGQLSIYPNPSEGIFYVNGDVSQKHPAGWEVFDSSLRKVLSGKIPSSGDFIIDLSMLSEGMYFLKIQSAHEVIAARLFKGS